MKKTIIEVSSILIIIVLAAGVLLYYTNMPTKQSEHDTNTAETSTQETDAYAISLIEARPEIIQWKQELADNPTAGTATFQVDDHVDNEYTIQVYESFDSHNATLNWYTVNIASGEVAPLFPIGDE